MRLSFGFTLAASLVVLAAPALAGLADDLALCRKSWSGAAQTAACGRVIAAPDADDMAKAEAYGARARVASAGEAAKQAFSDLAESIRLAPWNPEAFRLRAVLHQQAGDAAKALEDYSAAIAIAPKSDHYAARARIYSKLGDAGKAIADLTVAITLEPSEVRLLHERALIYLSKGDTAAAIRDFDAMLQDTGSVPYAKQQPLAGRAKSFLALGDMTRAIADATAVLALNPKSSSAALTRAEAYLKTGDNILALADATTAIAGKVRDSDPYRLRAEARFMTGDVAGARSDIAMAEMLAPESTEVAKLVKAVAGQVMMLGLGPAFGDAEEAYVICLNSRSNDETIAACAQVIADRGFADARKGYPYNILGHFYYERFLYDLAAENFTAAIATEQTSAANYSMLGLTFSNQKKYRESIAAYEEGLKYSPADAGLISGQASVQERSGDCAAALVNFAKSLRLKPDRHQYRGTARCLESQGSYAAAAAAYGEALKLEDKPKDKKFLLKLRAGAYAADGKIDLALQDVWSALALEPEDVSSHWVVAEALLMAGKPKDAIAVLTKAIPVDPRATHLVALRAKAHLQQGNLEWALADANTAANGPVKQSAWLLVRAQVRLAMKDFQGARGDVNEALAISPFSFEARAQKAAIEKAEAAE